MSAKAETIKSDAGFSLKEWIFTTDHKRVAVLYMIGSFAAFFVAGIMAMLMRIQVIFVKEVMIDSCGATFLMEHG